MGPALGSGRRSDDAADDQTDPPTNKRRVLSTAAGLNQDAFSTRDWLQFVAVGLIWGSAYLWIDIGLEAFEPGLIAWSRIVLGGTVLWVLPAARRRIAREDWPRLITLSVAWIAIPFMLFPLGQQYINSALTGMINSSQPIFATLIGAVLLSRLPGSKQLLGLLIGVVGIAAVTAPAAMSTDNDITGVALIVVAVAFYGLAVNIATPLQQRYGSISVMANILALAAVWTAPFGVLGLPSSRFEFGPVLAVVILGMLGTGIAFALMASLIGGVGAMRASFVTYLLPVVALALGITFRGDEVSVLSILGVLLVLTGAFLASRRERADVPAVQAADPVRAAKPEPRTSR